MNGSSEPLDAYQLVTALTGHGVDFVVIGGVALQAHGHVRTTVDLDVVAGWTPENLRHLADALGELGAKLRGVDADLLGVDLSDPETLHAGGNFLMHTRHGDLDVFAVEQTAGAPARYEDLRTRAITVEVRGITLLIAHPDDLIRMKTAAAQLRDRPAPKRRQDLDDIAVLQRLRASQQPEARQTRRPRRNPPPGPVWLDPSRARTNHLDATVLASDDKATAARSRRGAVSSQPTSRPLGLLRGGSAKTAALRCRNAVSKQKSAIPEPAESTSASAPRRPPAPAI